MFSRRNVFFLIIMLFISGITWATEYISPVGRWQTIDDVTETPRSVVEIYQTKDGALEGKIDKIYYRQGESEKDVCSLCMGDRYNKPFLGMVMMWNLKPTGENTWGDGKILDPKIGKIYNCKITLSDKGTRLIVRGYIGIALFGRNQTWLRVPQT